MAEYVDHLHEAFVDPVEIERRGIPRTAPPGLQHRDAARGARAPHLPRRRSVARGRRRMTVELVDAHVHFWDPHARRHAWLDAEPALRRPFGPSALDAGRHALTGMVVVQADCRDDQGLDEVAWFTALARDEPRIRGIVAFAPLDRDGVDAHLDALNDNDLVVGVRRLLQDDPASLTEQPAFVSGRPAARAARLHVRRVCARGPAARLDAARCRLPRRDVRARPSRQAQRAEALERRPARARATAERRLQALRPGHRAGRRVDRGPFGAVPARGAGCVRTRRAACSAATGRSSRCRPRTSGGRMPSSRRSRTPPRQSVMPFSRVPPSTSTT